MKLILLGALIGLAYFLFDNALDRQYNRGFAEGRGMALKTNPPSYVVGRKRPVTIRQAMKVLLISETHARRALDYFVLKGLAEMSKQGGVRFYRVKE